MQRKQQRKVVDKGKDEAATVAPFFSNLKYIYQLSFLNQVSYLMG